MIKSIFYIFICLLQFVFMIGEKNVFAEQPPTKVFGFEVRQKSFVDEVEALGTLIANESVSITATVTELITEINFEDGERVNKGHVLIKMDTAEEEAELAEEQSRLNEALRQLERLEPLVRRGAASQSDLDSVKREVETARSRIKAVESRIDQRVIKAPFSGVVGLRQISLGALVQPGTLITTLDADDQMKLDFSVPAVFLSTLEPGVPIVAKTKVYPEKNFEGSIASVDSRVDPVTRSVLVRAIIENEGHLLKPGILMQVTLKKNERKTLVIPESSLIPQGDDYFVFRATENEAGSQVEKVLVKIGSRRKGEVEILNGLSEKDLIVSEGTVKLRPGQSVTMEVLSDERSSDLERLKGKEKEEKK